jgi:uncharacterized protein YbbK (DUF523 family)
MSRPILVSACLLGVLTRYDGKSRRDERVLHFLQQESLMPVPVCPEQLAGLPTPRPATCFAVGDGTDVLDGTGRMVNSAGEEVREVFLRGAIETMKIARLAGCSHALLKERSPSCGVHQVYLGADRVAGRGVTAALLERNGLTIFSEEDLDHCVL